MTAFASTSAASPCPDRNDPVWNIANNTQVHCPNDQRRRG